MKRVPRAMLLQLFSFAIGLLPIHRALSAEPQWRLLEAPHYRVVSQLGDRKTLAWSREFDQFIASMSGVLKIDPAQLPPLTVVLFAREAGFEPYKPALESGEKASLGGVFSRDATWSVIGLAADSSSDNLRRVILHEATHWLMSVDEARRPAWFTEGIAEVLSTFEMKGKQVVWGKPVDSSLRWLTQGPVELESFLMLPNTTMDGSDSTALFYAQAWAFTHFLLFSQDASYQQLLPRFLQVYKTHSGPATVQQLLGEGLPDMERDFSRYLKTGRYRYVTQPPATLPPPSSPVPAPREVVESALGRLALGTQQLELAHQHAGTAIELDPTSPTGHELLAYLAVHDGAAEDIAAHAEAALKAGSKDSQMYVMLGDLLFKAPSNDRGRTARQRVNMYEHAINLDSRRVEPFEDLAASLFSLAQPAAEDAEFLALGLRIFPGNDWIRVGAAVVDFRLGRTAQAREKMALALQPDSTLDDDQRRAARGLLNGLLAGLAPEPEEVHEP